MNDIIGLLIDAGYLQSQFDAHPRDMWAYTVLVFLVGIGTGFAFSAMVKRHENRLQGRTGVLSAARSALGNLHWRATRRRRMRDTLDGLTPKMWYVVKQAYENGEFRAGAYDPYVNMLMEAGVLCAPPVLDIVGDNPYVLSPDYKNLLDEMWDDIKWIPN